MIRALLLAPLVAALSACAYSPLVSPSEEEAARAGRSKIWIAAFFPFDRFAFTESLDRFVYTSHTGNVYSIKGVWDPVSTLEAVVLDGVRTRFDVPASLARSHGQPAAFEKAVEDSQSEMLSRLEAGQEKYWMSNATDAMAAEAAAKGGEYLLEVWVQLKVFRSGGMVFIFNTWGRLIRLDTRTVVWCKPGLVMEPAPEVEDFKEYAANDLALFKEAFTKAAEKLRDPRGNWDVLGGLLPERAPGR